jgi:hypothetical protein
MIWERVAVIGNQERRQAMSDTFCLVCGADENKALLERAERAEAELEAKLDKDLLWQIVQEYERLRNAELKSNRRNLIDYYKDSIQPFENPRVDAKQIYDAILKERGE